jgi:UDP-N-acetylglucosamine 2-epimerase
MDGASAEWVISSHVLKHIIANSESVFLEGQPDAVLVLGDTYTTSSISPVSSRRRTLPAALRGSSST